MRVHMHTIQIPCRSKVTRFLWPVLQVTETIDVVLGNFRINYIIVLQKNIEISGKSV